jgi:hypothetical protein
MVGSIHLRDSICTILLDLISKLRTLFVTNLLLVTLVHEYFKMNAAFARIPRIMLNVFGPRFAPAVHENFCQF